MRKYDAALIFVLLMITLFGWAQEYKFRHITTVDGLSHNEVRKIVKDSHGFMWFGTQNGLNRYDGYRFKLFKSKPNDSTSIVGDKVFSLTASKDKLWVGTITGLSVLHTVSLKVIPTPELWNVFQDKDILQLFWDGSKKVWASTEDGNYIIDTDSYKVRTVLEDFKIVSMGKGVDNSLWIGTDQGLLKYNPEAGEIIKNYEIGAFNAYGLDEIFTNSYGEVWVTLGDGIFRFQSERDRFIEVYRSKTLNAISQSEKGDLFFGSYGNGLIRYSRDTGDFETLMANPENHASLSSNDVYDVYVGEEDIVWVGTQEGLDYYDYTRDRFQSLVHLPNNENSLSSSFVQTLFQDKDNTFWVGTREGVDHVVFEEGYRDPKITHMNMDNILFKALDSSYVSAIFRDSKDRMWIATMGDGLFLINEGQNLYRRYRHNAANLKSIASSSVRAVIEDHMGRIWFGTGGGLSLLVEEAGGKYSFENFGYPKYDSNSLPLNDIYTVFEDSKHRIWIGTNKGGVSLLQENGSAKSFLRFYNNPSDPKSLSNDEVFVIYEDALGRVWFGTSAAGLNLLMEDGIKEINNGYYFKRYTEHEGLSDNEVNAILEDGNANLWISTNTGISVFDVENELFTNYTTYDGVLKGKFRKNAKWKTKDGMMFFGGAAGVNYFDPKNFEATSSHSTPVFSDLLIDGKVVNMGEKLDGKVVLEQPLVNGSKIVLPQNDNRFQLEFSSLSFTSPYRRKYRYKLEGLDKDWHVTTGNDPNAIYANLDPGSYKFLLDVSEGGNMFSGDPVYIDIEVSRSPFDRFYVKLGLYVAVSLTIVFLWVAYRNNRKGKESYPKSPKSKKQHKTIDAQLDAENLNKVKELDLLMDREKIYMDSDLGLSQLAEKIDVSANHLSMLLNDYVGKNFYDYVNHYRVEEVKKRLVDPNYQKQTISSIGGDCGFNSKSAFNRIFKNMTGQTPSQYQKSTFN